MTSILSDFLKNRGFTTVWGDLFPLSPGFTDTPHAYPTLHRSGLTAGVVGGVPVTGRRKKRSGIEIVLT